MATRMDRACGALRDGRIDFDAFARETAPDWRRLAHHLHGRWRVPPSVSPEDVEQAMLLAAWRAVAKWEPDRGMLLHRYVVWCAMSGAAKMLHRERGALRGSGRALSRYAVAFSSLPGDEPDGPRELGDYPAGQESMVALSEWVREHPRDAALVEALLIGEGDLDRAARALLAEPTARLALGVESRKAARRELQRVADEVAARCAA